ncbi:MAG TPA: glycoside hydrolase family 13 protein [Elusimicrobiales bacterium]|nr:glycoside hydrolase family 13 protein [Elusimicrobiales bacterium]
MKKNTGVPEWAKGAVWYQIFPERFANGDPSNDPEAKDLGVPAPRGWKVTPWTGDWYSLAAWEKKNYGSFFRSVIHRRYGGDIQGIIDRLDHIERLGADAIYLNPVFVSSSHHKYDGESYHHIDPNFGPDPEGDRALVASAGETEDPATWVWTAADRLFLELVRRAHRRGIRIIIDGVFNHSGRGFFAFRDLLANGRASRYKDWYRVMKWNAPGPDGFIYRGWWGINDLPEFKRDRRTFNAGYKRYLFDITRRWLAPDGDTTAGTDGFRLDVAACIPHGFWKEWRAEVRAIKPDAYLTAEVADIDPAFVSGGEFHAMMNYPFAYASSSFFADVGNRTSSLEFDRALAELRRAYPEDVTHAMQNLFSSHDTPRLRSIIRNPDLDMASHHEYHRKTKTEFNPSYRTGRGGERERKVHMLMAAFQAVYIGAPMIYYGDEYGMTGANDPDCRKPMLWPDLAYAAESPRPDRRSGREPNVPDRGLFARYREFLSARKASPAIRKGTYRTLYAERNGHLFAFERRLGSSSAVCVFNAGETPRELSLRGNWRKKPDLLAGRAVLKTAPGALRIVMPPLEAAVLAPGPHSPRATIV